MDCGSLKSLILKQMVTRSIRMYTYADAMRWALDIAEGILSLHCHSPMVIHRDLKCDNIMLTTGSGRINGALVPGDASNVTAKIADLGLHALVQACSYNVDSQNSAADAKTPREPSRPLAFSKEYVQMQANGASAEQSAYEMTGQTGAYCYMAPEVVMNKPYNEKVDVFSFGVIIYELFSRRLLAADYMNTMEWDESKDHAYKVAAGYRPPFPASMPESLRSLIDSCWAGPPELRPRMKEVVRKLREIQKSGELDEMDAKAGAAAQAAGGCCAVM